MHARIFIGRTLAELRARVRKRTDNGRYRVHSQKAVMGDDPSRKSKLNGQMIPLTEATTVAYDIILRRAPLLHDSRDLEESRGLVALALSALATIYAVGDGGEAVPLSPAEIEEQLFFPTAQGMRDR